ncbi:MAG: peptide deformylase [Pedosphaera sp.]|nr:peptide deformylase [Pedosphaera sp.]
MVLPVVKYGDPVLRRRGENIVKIDLTLKQLVSDLFETMYAAHGIGLAAQQIGVAKQVAVVDVRGVKDRPSQLWVEGHTCVVDAFMPLVLINPLIAPSGDFEVGPEGCLSFPEIYGDIRRASEIDVTALNERGESFRFRVGGLLARAIQHEADHLNGLLFIDRMSSAVRADVREEVDELQSETKARLQAERRKA